MKNIHKINQHTYITDDSEIKEGDWFTDDNNSLKRSYKLSHVQFANTKKIILTTDQDLIKDGVQAIDDEFLEWLINNPTCEFVEVDKNWNYPLDKSWEYKLRIIPKEEQDKKLYSDEEVYNLLCSMPNFFNMTIPQQIKARDKWFEQFKKK